MFRLDCDSLRVTCITPGPGMTVAVQVYMPEDAVRSEGIFSVILYSPAEAIILVVLPPGPASLPVRLAHDCPWHYKGSIVQVKHVISNGSYIHEN